MKIKETDKCIIGIAIVITIVFTALALIVLKITYNHVDDDVETNLMNIARIVATDNEVIAKLSSEDMTLNDYINTYYDDIKDISFLKGLEHLRHLKIYENNISDYSPINNVKKVIK